MTGLLADRQKTHGDFADHARIAIDLKSIVADEAARRAGRAQPALNAVQRQALDMILDKLARIVAGDPAHRDHWDDIAGYAHLAIPFDPQADALGSYEAAIREIGAAVRAGAPLPASGYFGERGAPAPLTVALLIATSLQRSARWHGIAEWSISDWACALAGEAGELCNAVKKLRRIECEAPNRNESGRTLATREAAIAAIAEELADVILYAPAVAARLGIDLEAAIIAKFNATSERYGFPERLAAVKGGAE